MCSTPTSDKTTASSTQCNTSPTASSATTSKTSEENSTKIKTTIQDEIQEENSGENFVNNNNNNHRNTGKTSSTTCAKNKQVVLGQSGFQDAFTDAVENGKLSTAIGSSSPVSSETSDAATTTKSANATARALLTTTSIGSGRLAAGSRLAPGNQAIFGGGGGGKGTTANAVSDSAVYSKSGEDLIDNYGSDNAIISSGGSNPLTKRRNTKASVKRNQSKFQVPVQQQQQQQQQPNNSKRKSINNGKTTTANGGTKADGEIFLSSSSGDLLIDRKRRLIGDEFYSHRNGGILGSCGATLITPEDIGHLPTIVSNEEEDPDHHQQDPDHLHHPSDEILYSAGLPSNAVNASGVPLTLVDEESSEILKRINPEDLGISVDVHGNQTVVVTSVQGGSLMQDVILYNGSPALLVNGLSGHSMPPASSSPTDSNSSNDGSDLSSSPPLGSSSYGKYSNGGGGITLYGSPLSTSSLLGLPHHHHHQFPHHGDYGNQLSGSTVITSIADMASLLSQNVKNEPEDLTGARRDNPHQNNNNDPNSDGLQSSMASSQPMLKSSLDSKNGSPPVVVTTSDGQVVLSTDLSNATFVPVGPPHGGPNDHPSYGADFPGTPFDGSGRVIYPGDSYRTSDSDMYNPAPSPDFASTVQRVVSGDVQFVQYHYKGGSGGPPLGPQISSGPPGHGPHLNSPDSGIGDNALNQGPPEGFDNYPHSDILNDSYRRWNNEIRAPNEEKIQIPKIFTPYGFKYTMETPTSGSVRREDDRITYINKGQFYGLTLEYIMDPESPPLKSNTVKSVIMLVFREGKSSDDEMKAWQFWHGRQHSVKQRILDPDQKNSTGIVGGVEETLALNALVVYWNPLESPAKVNIAVQCLSTDFSTQKGVKGLPLHLQIDTYDDPRDPNCPVYHRGYAQIKVFCDKGAERKARDEERRASKRRTTPSGKRRLDEMYHTPLERSEFYSMADCSRPPILFSPPDQDKSALEFGSEIPSFYSRGSPPDPMLKLNGSSMPQSPEQVHTPIPSRSHYSPSGGVEPKLMRWDDAEIEPHHQHHLFESSLARPIHLDGELSALDITIKKEHHILPNSLSGGPLPEKRPKLLPLPHERIMIYVRQETEEAYTPLHLVPPSVPGLIRAIESKYKINARNIRYLYKKNKEGALVKLDDDMIKYYCNEDIFLMQVMVTEGLGGEESMVYDITLSET